MKIDLRHVLHWPPQPTTIVGVAIIGVGLFLAPAGISLPQKSARVVSPTGKHWTPANIGNALAGREISRHLRELGTNTRGPAPLTKTNSSRFLSALDTAL
jgi:uncharacterized protein YaiI (UPF0178 family)